MCRALKLVMLFTFLSLQSVASDVEDFAINQALDDFHSAAAVGDKSRYLALMTEQAVFMGTDEWERWPKKPDFIEYVNSRFTDGKGWIYRPVERHVAYSGGDIAWFDEVVVSVDNLRFRGTGVLVREAQGWKIAHYALSFLIPNEDWDGVINLITDQNR